MAPSATLTPDTTTTTPLVGDELLAVINSFPQDTPRDVLCTETGYIRREKDGKVKLLYQAMLVAMLEAKGSPIPGGKSPNGGGGPTPSFSASTLTKGQVVVGQCYTSLLGATHGDKWDIDVDETERTITLSLR